MSQPRREQVDINGQRYWPCRFKGSRDVSDVAIRVFLARDGLLSCEYEPFTDGGHSRTSRDFWLASGKERAEIVVFVRVDVWTKILADVLHLRYGRLRHRFQLKRNAAGAHFVSSPAKEPVAV